MWLTDEDVDEFRRLWKEEFGTEPSVALARERATQLLELYVLLARRRPDETESK
jgi:hypothetical protein